jgi:hypothetical protein
MIRRVIVFRARRIYRMCEHVSLPAVTLFVSNEERSGAILFRTIVSACGTSVTRVTAVHSCLFLNIWIDMGTEQLWKLETDFTEWLKLCSSTKWWAESGIKSYFPLCSGQYRTRSSDPLFWVTWILSGEKMLQAFNLKSQTESQSRVKE